MVSILKKLKGKFYGQELTNDHLAYLLEKASKDRSFVKTFYMKLLEAKIYVLTNENFDETRKWIANPGETISLLQIDQNTIPVFSKVDRIFDNGRIPEKINYIELPAKSLLEMTMGNNLILNPYSDHSKEFIPDEVRRILNGDFFTEKGEQVCKKETRVRIGVPAKYPSQIVENLIKLFETTPEIKSAYVAWIHEPESNYPPHYIFAVDLSENEEKIFPLIYENAKPYLGVDEIIDIIKLDGKINLESYFRKQSTPFYNKDGSH